ncbi:MAG: alpha/beta fold hydrolase [Dehalococcoidia bacterium]
MLTHLIAHPGGNEPLPTVLALHGHGAHGQDLIGLAPHLAGGRTLWICPQAEFPVEPGFYGFTWFERDANGQRASSEPERTLGVLREFIDEAFERYPVDRERVVLLGFSQGGMLAYRIALSEPRRFKGLAALSTTLSEEMAAGLVLGEGASELPVLVQHGLDDPMITIDRARETRDRLEALGLDAEYHEYSMGHAIGQESALDLNRWLESVLGLGASAGLV